MPWARAFIEDLAVDALSIIANPQPEELAIVRDLCLNAAGVCVVKGVPQDLARNPVDLVLKERRQGLPCSFQSDLEYDYLTTLTLRLHPIRQLVPARNPTAPGHSRRRIRLSGGWRRGCSKGPLTRKTAVPSRVTRQVPIERRRHREYRRLPKPADWISSTM
jgi:hypothetical protein